jgi:hypothetical protein
MRAFVLLLLLSACSGGDVGTDFECDYDGDGDREPEANSPVPLGQLCGQAGQDRECGTDRGYAYLADLTAKEIGQEFDCAPAGGAGEYCLDVMDIAAGNMTEEACADISGTE